MKPSKKPAEGDPDRPLTRKERQDLARRWRRREKLARRWQTLALRAAAAVIVLAAAVWGLYALLDRPGEKVAYQGAQHVPPGTPVRYNSDPPTSGPHYDASAPAQISAEPIDDGLLVHSLEHGYVIISYNCDELSAEECGRLVSDLSEVARAERLWKLIVVPRPALDTRIALTAWTRIDRLEEFDRRRIGRFIRAWRDKGPEKTPD